MNLTKKDAIATITIKSKGNEEEHYIYDWSDILKIQNFIDITQIERFNS